MAKQEALIGHQQREITALSASLRDQALRLQKVSEQLQANKSTAQIVASNQ